jgi:hypothetical protein
MIVSRLRHSIHKVNPHAAFTALHGCWHEADMPDASLDVRLLG